MIASDVKLQLAPFDPIAAYASAFAEWGLTPETPVEDASEQLQALHPSLKSMVHFSKRSMEANLTFRVLLHVQTKSNSGF